MTNFGIIEKGRLIEIEALYVSLFGLAIIFWLSFFLQRKSPWLIWLPASVFLGLGLLAKGPTHLHIFLRRCDRRSRLLERLAASCSSCTFCRDRSDDWDRGGMGNSIPPRHDIARCDRQWSGQFTGRLKGIDFKFSDWIQNYPVA